MTRQLGALPHHELGGQRHLIRMQKAQAISAFLPPMPEAEMDLGAVPPCKGHGSTASQDILDLAELASSCLIRSGDQRGMRHFGVKSFLFHLSENRQRREAGMQCKTKQNSG